MWFQRERHRFFKDCFEAKVTFLSWSFGLKVTNLYECKNVRQGKASYLRLEDRLSELFGTFHFRVHIGANQLLSQEPKPGFWPDPSRPRDQDRNRLLLQYNFKKQDVTSRRRLRRKQLCLQNMYRMRHHATTCRLEMSFDHTKPLLILRHVASDSAEIMKPN